MEELVFCRHHDFLSSIQMITFDDLLLEKFTMESNEQATKAGHGDKDLRTRRGNLMKMYPALINKSNTLPSDNSKKRVAKFIHRTAVGCGVESCFLLLRYSSVAFTAQFSLVFFRLVSEQNS